MEKKIDSEPFLLNKNDFIKATNAKRKLAFGLALFLNFCLFDELFSQDFPYKP